MPTRLFSAHDMARISSAECAGCGACCRGMGDTIVLDPYDIWQLTAGTGKPFQALLGNCLDLHVEEGVILPHLMMRKDTESCTFLGPDGRCTIHEFRPGICRLYPLGRSWENGDFTYILQVNECSHCTGAKVRVKKWIGIPDLARYEEFCRSWHHFLEQVRGFLAQNDPEGTLRRQICVELLRRFYLTPWTDDDFYAEYGGRLKDARRSLGFAV